MLDSLLSLDASLTLLVSSLQSPWLDAPMLAVTAAGQRGVVWGVIALVVAWQRPNRSGGCWQLVLALFLAWMAVDIALKPLVARERPFADTGAVAVVGDRPVTPAFPSGHAATAFAGALVVGRMWRRGRMALWALAALIAISRVYLGVHYVSDVTAGAAIGAAIAYLAVSTTWWDEPRGSSPATC